MGAGVNVPGCQSFDVLPFFRSQAVLHVWNPHVTDSPNACYLNEMISDVRHPSES